MVRNGENTPEEINDHRESIDGNADLHLLGLAIARVAEMPDFVAGKSTEKVLNALRNYYELLRKHWGQQTAENCVDLNTILMGASLADFAFIQTKPHDYEPWTVSEPDLDENIGLYVIEIEFGTKIRQLPEVARSNRITVNLINPLNGISCRSLDIWSQVEYTYWGGVDFRGTPFFDNKFYDCLIFSVNESGADDDFTYDDRNWNDVREIMLDKLSRFFSGSVITTDRWISLIGLWSLLAAAGMGTLDSSTLETMLRSQLSLGDWLSGTTYAEQMVDRFIAGSGETWLHSPDSELSKRVKQDGNFNALVRKVKEQIEARLRANNGIVDCGSMQLKQDWDSLFFGKLDPEIGWPIGGTQGLDIRVITSSIDPSSTTYSFLLEFTIYDDFGVGENDLYAPSLVAFWLLQHVVEFPGNHKPFVNKIVVEETLTGNY